MQIKLNGKSVLINNLRYNNVFLIDIDENRIEINDSHHMVIGTTECNDFAIMEKNTQPLQHIEKTIHFKNGATIITEDGDFYDIYKINKNALTLEVIGANGEIDGRINHMGNSMDINIAEYDANGHLTGDMYELEM